MWILACCAAIAATLGYYRDPTLRGDTVVFVAEGDLWRTTTAGGTASRLTTHPGAERSPRLSPDGTQLAFGAAYEGSNEVWLMPLAGGRPTRLTWTGSGAWPVGWTADGKVLVATSATSGLPDVRLLTVDPADGATVPVPLAQAANGAYAPDGTLFFTRFRFQGSHTRRYEGGTAQDVWALRPGADEAVNLTAASLRTDRDPYVDGGRVWFLSDRDGATNLWSMAPDGSDPKQTTHATDIEVREAAVDGGRAVVRIGADLHLVDLASGSDRVIPIALDSDFDQTREQWIEDPLGWVTNVSLSADGGRLALTARGQVFVFPTGNQGRVVTLSEPGVRYRSAEFQADGSLVAGSDRTGEYEWWQLPASGVGDPTQLTTGGTILRWEAAPSPDGRWLAHTDRNQDLWLRDATTGEDRKIDHNEVDLIGDLTWSADGRWLAYRAAADNMMRTVKLYDTATGAGFPVTTDRANTYAPTFSHDGEWLYVLSERHLQSVVQSPWDPLLSQPFFDRATVILGIALKPGLRSPFAPATELNPEAPPPEPDEEKERKRAKRKKGPGGVEVVADGITARLIALPLPPGNLWALSAGRDRLFWMEGDAGGDSARLMMAPIDRKDVEPVLIAEGVGGYALSADRTRLLVIQGGAPFVVDATFEGGDLEPGRVDLSSWRLSVQPLAEWRQMFDDAWRLERDYFYDPGMHGVDWPAMRARYRPLVDRVTDRGELSDLVAQMVGELSALHTFVVGGDHRHGDDGGVLPASLGADLTRDEAAGGWRVVRVWASDPDRPELRSPLARMGSEVLPGEVITRIDGVDALSVPDPGALLRGKGGTQVLLHVVAPAVGKRGKPVERDVVIVPLWPWEAGDRRYHEWEWSRAQIVKEAGAGRLAYVHLRAMGASDMAAWVRAYLPSFDREGLIVDVRHNGGGNIDSWLLERLLRKAWMRWSQRVGKPPQWNMQQAFRGHVVVLCDAFTGSDGEAFSEGFRRLGIGPVIGTRTWGGEIWLSMDNALVDGGIASAGEYGVFGPEGTWLIEGRGVEPDQVVDNLPAATYRGEDAQLDAAIAYLLQKLETDPIPPLSQPEYPDKSR